VLALTKKHDGYTVIPFPKVRLRGVDFLRLMQRKPVIHALMEMDVSKPRQYIREYKARTGESLSFTAFVIYCLGKAIDEDKRMHAYRQGNKLVLFDEVDITTVIEHEVGDEKIATPYVFRAVNKRTLRDIHREMRAAQADKVKKFKQGIPWYENVFFSLPQFIRVAIFGAFGKSPHLMKKIEGTVIVTAVGMFGNGIGWGIPLTNYTLGIALGGIGEKPGVVDGRVEIREYLSMTISVDHDIIDGAPLARFAARLRELIEDGFGLIDQAP
jgi:pyruvate/2-oxoglutarate dehydrogenase complex dihydrolipoamide acyltransferase (E2) component